MDPTELPTSIDNPPASEFSDKFAETARILFSADSVTETLTRVVELALATIEGCDYSGLFLVEGDTVTTPIHNDPIVDEIHALQHRLEEGPCLDAISQRAMLYADDIDSDPRWPRFGPDVGSLGIRSALALPLNAEGCLGALNLYARFPAAFGVVDRAKGLILASLAGLAISAARTHEDDDRRTEHLHAALITREVIGQAQGILMERERISAGQAFDVLRRASQHLNRKLRDVAQDLVDTGDNPDTGSRPAQ
jgi:GAF domain-containing protein